MFSAIFGAYNAFGGHLIAVKDTEEDITLLPIFSFVTLFFSVSFSLALVYVQVQHSDIPKSFKHQGPISINNSLAQREREMAVLQTLRHERQKEKETWWKVSFALQARARELDKLSTLFIPPPSSIIVAHNFAYTVAILWAAGITHLSLSGRADDMDCEGSC